MKNDWETRLTEGRNTHLRIALFYPTISLCCAIGACIVIFLLLTRLAIAETGTIFEADEAGEARLLVTTCAETEWSGECVTNGLICSSRPGETSPRILLNPTEATNIATIVMEAIRASPKGDNLAVYVDDVEVKLLFDRAEFFIDPFYDGWSVVIGFFIADRLLAALSNARSQYFVLEVMARRFSLPIATAGNERKRQLFFKKCGAM